MFDSALIVLTSEGFGACEQLVAVATSDAAVCRYLVLESSTPADGVEDPAAPRGEPPPQVDAALVETIDIDDTERIAALLDSIDVEVIIIPGPPLPRTIQSVIARAARPIVWSQDPPNQLAHIAVPVLRGPASALPAALLLRERLTGDQTVHFLVPTIGERQPMWTATDAAQFLGFETPLGVDVVKLSLAHPVEDLLGHLANQQVDCLALPSATFKGFVGERVRSSAMESRRPLALLFVPGPQAQSIAVRLDASDLVQLDAAVGFVQTEDAIGIAHPTAIEEIALYSRGTCLARVPVIDGRFAVSDIDVDVVGLASSRGRRVREIETDAFSRVHLPDSNRLALIDGGLEQFDALQDRLVGLTPWAVRLDHNQVFRALRTRSSQIAIRAVVDAGAILNDGHPHDLPDSARSVRLERVARYLDRHGFTVGLLVVRSDDGPQFLSREPISGEDVLHQLAGARPSTATSFDLELDNHSARKTVLNLIASARHRVHVQVYTFDEDPISRQLVDAMSAAASAGIEIRVLVDSLLSQHGSLGMTNTLLEHLEAHASVTVSRVRPIAKLPSVADLKLRNHRKIIVVDSETAVIGGRNVGQHYYRGFDEVRLTPSSLASDIPWLDSSATVRGPVVEQIEATFRRSWIEAGGDDFKIDEATPSGTIAARFVVHEGLRDAHALETYRWIFDSAEQHIYVINTFPLQIELQARLVAALRRGVRVAYLVGNPRPYHGEHVKFAGWTMREVAARLVFGRLDPLVEAGARVREFVAPAQPSWSDELGAVHPHVHAKLASSDGARLLIGSSNVDITSAYWESEGILVVEDGPTVSRAEADFERLLQDARPLSSEDEVGRRGWIARLWPSILG